MAPAVCCSVRPRLYRNHRRWPDARSLRVLGVQDVVAKSIGSSNPHNMIKATFSALTGMQAPRSVAQKRGKRVADVLGGKRGSDDQAAAS